MNIDELIHDLRARINPQYFDQPGTESHERYQVVVALEYLRQENTRLRESAKTIGELEQLAARSNNNLLVEIERLREENERLHFDILAMNQSLDSLREENKRLRKDAEVGAAIQRAAAELPAGYIVGISVEKDAATVDLAYPTGHIRTMDVDDDNRVAAEINAAIDAARGAK